MDHRRPRQGSEGWGFEYLRARSFDHADALSSRLGDRSITPRDSAPSPTEATRRARDAGADDHVTKPFDVGELLAGVLAVTRRTVASEPAPVVRVGDVAIDLQTHRVTRTNDAAGAESVRLTPTEWHVLEVVVRNPERLVTQRQLISDVRGPADDDAAHYLRQYLAQLRRTIEPDPSRPRYLLTEPGMGYRFQPEGP